MPSEITERVLRKERPGLEAQLEPNEADTDESTARGQPAPDEADTDASTARSQRVPHLSITDEGTTLMGADGDDESSTLAEQDREAGHCQTLIEDDESETLADPHVKAPDYEPEHSPDVALLDEPSHAGETRRIRPGERLGGAALPFRAGPRTTAPSPQVRRAEPLEAWPSGVDRPEAITSSVKVHAPGEPALPFQPPGSVHGREARAGHGRAAAQPGSERVPESGSTPTGGSVWATTGELDPTALPSSQLTEIARPDTQNAPKAKRSRWPLLLLALALLIGFAGTALMLHCGG